MSDAAAAAPLLGAPPHDRIVARVAGALRVGVLLNALLLGGLVAAALLTLALPGVPGWVRAGLLLRWPGGDGQALALLVLLTLGGLAGLLLAWVGALAREVWALLLLVALLLAAAISGWRWGHTGALLLAGPVLAALMVALRGWRAFRPNPVAQKELRGRMRGMRAFVVLTVYLGLMSSFMALVYLLSSSVSSASAASVAGQLGRTLFVGVVGAQMLLIAFIAPAFTAGAITGERERQTYDLLQTTLLSMPSFVVGKLESALGYVLLLLLAALPLQAVTFLFGGISQAELLLAFVLLAVMSVALGAIGLFFSTVAPRTLSASVRTYATALAISFGVPLVGGVIVSVARAAFASNTTLDAALAYLGQLFVALNPVATALESQRLLVEQQQLGFSSMTLVASGATVPIVSPWVAFAVLYLALAALMLLLAVRQSTHHQP